LIEDPTPAHTLLEKLKPDEALYVWISVAICFYDITKDNPEIMLN
jgi:3-methyladenine DNA glycosylase AlkC